MLRKVLQRDGYSPMDNMAQSQANFDELIAISIGDGEYIRPSREFLRDFIDPEKRRVSGTLNYLDQDPCGLHWQQLRDRNDEPLTYDIPVNVTFLSLARCRPTAASGESTEDCFQDLSTYGDMRRIFEEVTQDKPRWRDNGRYYGIELPDPLRDNVSVNGVQEETMHSNGVAESVPAYEPST